MRFSTSVLLFSPLLISLTSSACLPGSGQKGHHHSSGSASATATSGSQDRASNSTATATSATPASTGATLPCIGTSVNGICFGALPDDGKLLFF